MRAIIAAIAFASAIFIASAVTAQDFEIGDTVQMTSGGPVMTVTGFGEYEDGVPYVQCAWFVEGEKKWETFMAATLAKVDSSFTAVITLEPTSDSIGADEKSTKSKKVCIVCEGKYYCVKGGCAKTPCGWICSD